MGRPDPLRIDAGFDYVLAVRHIDRHWDEYCDPDFWRRLNPQLHVSECPFEPPDRAHVSLAPDVIAAALIQLDASGFLLTPPVIPPARLAPVERAIETLASHGIPTGFAAVYDEFYQLFDGLSDLFAPILGEQYRWLGHGFWSYRVPPGDRGVSDLSGPGMPHRDSLGPDPRVMAGERPGILNVWLPLTHVTTADSCIYVVSKSADKAYATADRTVHLGQFDLQDIRALPVQAGGIVAWSTHLAHWGSRSSSDARAPRMSLAMYCQRRDVPPFDRSVFDVGAPIPLTERLRWVLQSFGAQQFLSRLPEPLG